jgi:hypothetical protein
MHIELKKFGNILVSRPNGREALLAYQPILNTLKKGETIEIDFAGVVALGPSWGDEFLSPILKAHKGKIKLLHKDNASVKATLKILEEIREKEEEEGKVRS